ncbi:MAG: hypothetical protein ACI9K2_007603 [Myxococcota bacterium]|jgi:hypothetical protein
MVEDYYERIAPGKPPTGRGSLPALMGLPR